MFLFLLFQTQTAMASSESPFGGWDSEDKVKEELQEFIDDGLDDPPPLPVRQSNHSVADQTDRLIDEKLMEKQGSNSVLS